MMGAEGKPLRILAVDDTPANLALLRAALTQAGHTVITATNGEEALACFVADKPDVVLMDVMMPGIGGIEATRRMRALHAEHWVPIIFISALSHRDDMVRGLEAGGDDYLAKPVDLVLLLAKINAMQRVATLESKLHEANKKLRAYRDVSEYELGMAKELIERMEAKSSVPVKGVELWLQPATNLSGDLVITQQYRDERSYVLLADAMGHGLPAALPLLPLAQVFSSMAREGFTVAAIAREMNARLNALLPSGNFVAVTLLSIDRGNRFFEIWNGGNPAALLLDVQGNISKKFTSRHPALGILNERDFNAATECSQWHDESVLALHSDGLPDAVNAGGESFGETRILAALQGNAPHRSLRNAVQNHLDGQSPNDDISFATIALQ